MDDGVPVKRRRGPGKNKKCASDGEKCYRCDSRTGCCLKKATPCGKGECVVCSSPQQADGAATTPTVTKRSSRIPRQTPVAATAGSESGEKKPKHATNAAECEAKRKRKIKQAQYNKKKKDKQKQGT